MFNPKDQKKAQEILKDLHSDIKQLDARRAGGANTRPMNVSFEEFIEGKYNLSRDAFMETLGVDLRSDTMQNIFMMPNQEIRWLVPEIIRSAIHLGLAEAPIYPRMIASEQSINGLSAIMPIINPSDATPAYVNEGETIPIGDVSFGQKSVTLFKVGRGFKLTDEVKNYVSLDVLAIFLRDFGIQLGYALDNLAIDILLNGNAAGGTESAPVIGVASTSDGITYKDMLRIWIRSSRMGRNFKSLVSGEDVAMDILDLDEFKLRRQGTPDMKLDLKTPVPSQADFFIHGGISANQLLFVDPRFALIKLNAQALMLESERIVSNQTEATYASLTTGFSKMYVDAAVLLDGSKAYSSYGFPSSMDIDTFLQNYILK